MKRTFHLILSLLLCMSIALCATTTVSSSTKKISIVGGGIIGALESYYAYQDAQKNGTKLLITVYDKNDGFGPYKNGAASTNTAYNIVPSLTTDEILCVVPRGSELAEKLKILFSQPGGIRVDDVPGVNDSDSAIKFKKSVVVYGSDKNHDDRTTTLLQLGKRSMDLWQQIYDEGDAELKTIFAASNFHPCHEQKNGSKRSLQDGYRIDLIYNIPNAKHQALSMQADYEKLGYKNCTILSPDEVVALDPFLSDFCQNHSVVDAAHRRIWNKDSVALWRPGGCIDASIFIPKFYAYLEKKLGQYQDEDGRVKNCFQYKFGNEVTGVIFDSNANEVWIKGMQFGNGTQQLDIPGMDCEYVFCPGEAVGTLHNLGFQEPAYASFAGPSLMINIPLTSQQIEQYKSFSHWMEVHNVGIVLAWQARFKDNGIFIGVAGTKAFYGDKQPGINEDFAKNRNLVHLNMINNVLSEFISLAFGYDTTGKMLSASDLSLLESKGIAQRWVGRRAVAYDGFPTLGRLYRNNQIVMNARCTTHLGSGGVSFGPAAVLTSRSSEGSSNDILTQKVLMYADSKRVAAPHPN